MKKLCTIFFITAISLIFILYGFPGVSAQEANSDEFTLEEVTVTAEKREEDVQKIAISMTAITGSVIRDQAMVDLMSVLEEVPALTMMEWGDGRQLFIRGIGANQSELDPGVIMMFDGVYSGRAEALNLAMYDLDRIEVLRGPQGTLYGKNAIGGSVNVISQAPILGTYEGFANLQVGNYGLYHVDGAVNVPFNDNFAIRVAGLRELRDGYFSNNANESNLEAARFKAKYEPNDSLSVILTTEYSYMGGLDKPMGMGAVPMYMSEEILETIPGFPFYPAVGAYNPDDPWWMDDGAEAPGQRHRKFFINQIDFNYDFNLFRLTLLPSYVHSNRVVYNAQGVGNPEAEDQYSVEARLTSPEDSKLEWLFGLYYIQSEDKPIDQADYFETPHDIDANDEDDYIEYRTSDVPVYSYAAFAQATYPWTDRFRLTGGVRYTKDDKYRDVGMRSIDGAYDTGLIDVSVKYDKTTFKAGFEYDLREDSMLYGGVQTGYKAGGFTPATVPPIHYDPEDNISYSIGSKNRFMNDRIQINGEAYYYEYTGFQISCNTQVPVAIPEQYLPCYDDPGGCQGPLTEFGGFIATADTGKSYGAEVETRFLITANDEASLTLTYSDAKYGETDTSEAGQFPTLLTDPILSNKSVSLNPKWTIDLGYEHSWDLANGGRIVAEGQFFLSAGYWNTIEQWYPGAWTEGYHKSNAFLKYFSPGDKWSLNTWVRNIENADPTLFVFPWYRRMIGDPRTYGLNFTYRWQ